MLTKRQSEALRSLGWHPPKPEESPNFYRDWDAKDEEDRRLIAHAATRTLVEVYGFRPEAELVMELYLEGADDRRLAPGDDAVPSLEERNGSERHADPEGCECPLHLHAGVWQTFDDGRNVQAVRHEPAPRWPGMRLTAGSCSVKRGARAATR